MFFNLYFSVASQFHL